MADTKLKGTGALFKNTRKERDNQPDYTGNFKMTKPLLKSYIEAFKKDPGLEELAVELAGWKKQGRAGEFISVSVSPPFEKKAPAKKDDFDDSIPF